MEKDLCFSSCCFDMDTSTTSTHSELRLLCLALVETRKDSKKLSHRIKAEIHSNQSSPDLSLKILFLALSLSLR